MLPLESDCSEAGTRVPPASANSFGLKAQTRVEWQKRRSKQPGYDAKPSPAVSPSAKACDEVAGACTWTSTNLQHQVESCGATPCPQLSTEGSSMWFCLLSLTCTRPDRRIIGEQLQEHCVRYPSQHSRRHSWAPPSQYHSPRETTILTITVASFHLLLNFQ